ncbi:HTH_Tnp_Tc3_2 domain-containing protein [Trichonephila clavipes]|nr:HTH_Tnp_Tc3_2 domain-containing protein [Trichonephila clavipes]
MEPIRVRDQLGEAYLGRVSGTVVVAAVAEWYRYRIVACLVTSSIPVPLKTRRITREQDQQRLTRIIKRDRRATLPQIAPDFNAGPSTSVTMRTIQRNIIDMGFRSQKSTRVPLLTA